jgi:hypothetical protein
MVESRKVQFYLATGFSKGIMPLESDRIIKTLAGSTQFYNRQDLQ